MRLLRLNMTDTKWAELAVSRVVIDAAVDLAKEYPYDTELIKWCLNLITFLGEPR